ncbi:MAG: hypothetical protein JWP81_3961 [Ferruginibacter sp.]|nr:hypothetical protein [Ferruginibacter sp.]
MTEKDFNISIIKPVQFSLATSKIAVENATDARAKEFAGFELAETTVLLSVLKDLETILPEMDETARTAFNEIESQEVGAEFDRLYIKAQLQTHRLLRDLTEEYIKQAPGDHLIVDELQTRHIAALALVMFKEHVAITERLSKELSGESE